MATQVETSDPLSRPLPQAIFCPAQVERKANRGVLSGCLPPLRLQEFHRSLLRCTFKSIWPDAITDKPRVSVSRRRQWPVGWRKSSLLAHKGSFQDVALMASALLLRRSTSTSVCCIERSSHSSYPGRRPGARSRNSRSCFANATT